MKKQKRLSWKLILTMILMAALLCILIHGLTDTDLKRKENSRLAADESVYYLATKDGRFIELTQTGDNMSMALKEKQNV